jgi:hypothetical protein
MELYVAMLLSMLRKIQKSRKAFLKRLSKICLPRREKVPLHFHFLKKCLSLFKKAYLNQRKSFSTSSKKVFSGKKSDQTKRKEMFFYTPQKGEKYPILGS